MPTTRPSILFVLTTTAVLLSGSRFAEPGAAQQSAPTPLELFQRLLPVIRHDRCINCHGDVDPFTGRDHVGGAQTAEECKKCHKVKGWTTPGPEHFFVGKSDRDLCGLFSDFASKQGHQLFITNHLRGDLLIVDAFLGRAGGQIDPAEPPPIKQEPFIALAQDWLDRGYGACEVEGTITHEESVHSEDVWKLAAFSDDSSVQNAKRTVTITRSGSGFQARIENNGTTVGTHVEHLQDAQGRPCTVTITVTNHWSGTTSGPAKVEANYGVFYGDTNPALGQRDYYLDVILPPEHTTHKSSGSIANHCGIRVPPIDPDTQEIDRDPVKITFEGHIDDPKQTNLVGMCDRTLKHGDVGLTFSPLEMPCNRFKDMGNAETPAIMLDADVARHDGSDITFRAYSFWNIRYTK